MSVWPDITPVESWFYSHAIFPISKDRDIHAEIEELSEKIADLDKHREQINLTGLSNQQKREAMALINLLLQLTSHHMHNNKLTKARSLLSRIPVYMNVLPRGDGDLGRLNLELKWIILGVCLHRDKVRDMADRLLEHSREFLSFGVSHYLVVVYQFMLALCYVRMQEQSLFYNRSKILCGIITRTIKRKFEAEVSDLGPAMIISLKGIDQYFASKKLYLGMIIFSMFFEFLSERIAHPPGAGQDDHPHVSRYKKIAINCISLADSLGADITPILNKLFKSINYDPMNIVVPEEIAPEPILEVPENKSRQSVLNFRKNSTHKRRASSSSAKQIIVDNNKQDVIAESTIEGSKRPPYSIFVQDYDITTQNTANLNAGSARTHRLRSYKSGSHKRTTSDLVRSNNFFVMGAVDPFEDTEWSAPPIKFDRIKQKEEASLPVRISLTHRPQLGSDTARVGPIDSSKYSIVPQVNKEFTATGEPTIKISRPQSSRVVGTHRPTHSLNFNAAETILTSANNRLLVRGESYEEGQVYTKGYTEERKNTNSLFNVFSKDYGKPPSELSSYNTTRHSTKLMSRTAKNENSHYLLHKPTRIKNRHEFQTHGKFYTEIKTEDRLDKFPVWKKHELNENSPDQLLLVKGKKDIEDEMDPNLSMIDAHGVPALARHKSKKSIRFNDTQTLAPPSLRKSDSVQTIVDSPRNQVMGAPPIRDNNSFSNAVKELKLEDSTLKREKKGERREIISKLTIADPNFLLTKRPGEFYEENKAVFTERRVSAIPNKRYKKRKQIQLKSKYDSAHLQVMLNRLQSADKLESHIPPLQLHKIIQNSQPVADLSKRSTPKGNKQSQDNRSSAGVSPTAVIPENGQHKEVASPTMENADQVSNMEQRRTVADRRSSILWEKAKAARVVGIVGLNKKHSRRYTDSIGKIQRGSKVANESMQNNLNGVSSSAHKRSSTATTGELQKRRTILPGQYEASFSHLKLIESKKSLIDQEEIKDIVDDLPIIRDNDDDNSNSNRNTSPTTLLVRRATLQGKALPTAKDGSMISHSNNNSSINHSNHLPQKGQIPPSRKDSVILNDRPQLQDEEPDKFGAFSSSNRLPGDQEGSKTDKKKNFTSVALGTGTMLHHYNKVKEKRLEDGKVREGTKESDPKEPSADASNLLQIEVQGRLRDNSYYEANKNSKGNNVLPESEFNTNAMFKPTSKELDKSLSHANKKKKPRIIHIVSDYELKKLTSMVHLHTRIFKRRLHITFLIMKYRAFSYKVSKKYLQNEMHRSMMDIINSEFEERAVDPMEKELFNTYDIRKEESSRIVHDLGRVGDREGGNERMLKGMSKSEKEIETKTGYYPKLIFAKNFQTCFLDLSKEYVNNCRKMTIRVLPARLNNQQVQISYFERAKGNLITIYVNSDVGRSGFLQKGIGTWINLERFLRSYIDAIDMDTLYSIPIDSHKDSSLQSIATMKFKLILRLVVFVLTHNSILVRNCIGGYKVTLLDSNNNALRNNIQMLRHDRELLRQRTTTKLLKHEDDKAGQIYELNVMRQNGGNLLERLDLIKIQQELVNLKSKTIEPSLSEDSKVYEAVRDMTQFTRRPHSRNLDTLRRIDTRDNPLLDLNQTLQDGLPIDLTLSNKVAVDRIGANRLRHRPSIKLDLNESLNPDKILDMLNEDNNIRMTTGVLHFSELIHLLEDPSASLKNREHNQILTTNKLKRYGQLHKIDNRLFSLVFPSGRDIFIVHYKIALSCYENAHINFTRSTLKQFVHKLQLEISMEMFGATSKHLTENQLLIAKIQFEKIAKTYPDFDRAHYYGIREFVLTSSIPTYQKCRLMDFFRSITEVRQTGVSFKDIGDILLVMGSNTLALNTKSQIELVAYDLLKKVAKHLVKKSQLKLQPKKLQGIPPPKFLPDPEYDNPLEYPSFENRYYFYYKTHLVTVRINFTHSKRYKGEATLRLNCYAFELGLTSTITLTDRAAIDRFFNSFRLNSHTLELFVLKSLLTFEKPTVGSRFYLHGRDNSFGVKTGVERTELKRFIYRADVRNDILSMYDCHTFRLKKMDKVIGIMVVTATLFYTFKNFDCLLYLEFQPSNSKNIVHKIALNKLDLEAHVSKQIREFIHNKPKLVHLLEKLVDSIDICRQSLYSRPMIRYTPKSRASTPLYFINKHRCSQAEDRWTERLLQENSILGQFTKRFGKYYAICTVRRLAYSKGFEAEIFFTKLQKRFSFTIFNEELLELDKDLLHKIYEISSAEIMYIIEQKKFNYQEILAEITKLQEEFKVNASSEDPDWRNKSIRRLQESGGSLVLETIKKRKNKDPLSNEEAEIERRTNKVLMFYQFERIVSNMNVRFNPSNQPILQISNFTGILKETLLQSYGTTPSNQLFHFEITCVIHSPDKPTLWKLHRYLGSSKILEMKLHMKILMVETDTFKNDSMRLVDALSLFPEIQEKINNGRFQYSDLLKIAESMYHSFRRNYSNSTLQSTCPETNQISHFVQSGMTRLVQKCTSEIRFVDHQYIKEEFPVLLAREVFTTRPMRLIVIMIKDTESIQFLIYSSDSNMIFSRDVEISSFESELPYFKQMMFAGLRLELGKRLISLFKNSLLLETFSREEIKGEFGENRKTAKNRALPIELLSALTAVAQNPKIVEQNNKDTDSKQFSRQVTSRTPSPSLTKDISRTQRHTKPILALGLAQGLGLTKQPKKAPAPASTSHIFNISERMNPAKPTSKKPPR